MQRRVMIVGLSMGLGVASACSSTTPDNTPANGGTSQLGGATNGGGNAHAGLGGKSEAGTSAGESGALSAGESGAGQEEAGAGGEPTAGAGFGGSVAGDGFGGSAAGGGVGGALATGGSGGSVAGGGSGGSVAGGGSGGSVAGGGMGGALAGGGSVAGGGVGGAFAGGGSGGSGGSVAVGGVGGAACGASGLPCADGSACSVNQDCSSKICNGAVCQVPTCGDQVQNQDETGTDCGGICAVTKSCPNSANCTVPADCDSYVCTNQKCVAGLVVAAADVLDDFEDGDVYLPTPASSHGNRVGSWFVFGDAGGIISRSVVAMKRGASTKVMHVTGVGFANWGSEIGVDFNNDGVSAKKPYDASQYAGITFWARGGKATSVTVTLPDIATDSAAVGHTCTNCDHYWSSSVSVTTEWQRFTIAFSSLVLEPGTDPAPAALHTSGLTSLEFIERPLPLVTESYDLWIDDVAFVR